MQRYFAEVNNNQVFLSELDAHHLLHVMRNKVGDKIEVANNKQLFLAEVKSINPLIIGVTEELQEESELPVDVTLFVCLLKGDKNEFVMQKATEIGANRIYFINSKRSVAHLDQQSFDKKLARYKLIVKEASEQSHRLVVPEILGIKSLKQINKSDMSDINFIAYEDEHTKSPNLNEIKNIKDKSISIIIGPEGGFDKDEVDYLNSIGFKSVSLGKRILRAETACLYSLSVISYLLESEK